ncbi:hypothetical protein HII36_23935 [Nonomuraea sp. NN258]|uniref:hypothetical protein n=1 Tax=Nonomuraea antri TaxID=2730852 RepID=UPI0015683658|nr:hypothetical protein [Nonomuraea antri]NRQ34859.1 hypothetical protein [Nonomuraea antri]
MEKLAVEHGDPALGGFELDFYHDGVRSRKPLGASWSVRFEQVPPVRTFGWAKGGTSFAGWYYSVTNADHIGYESWPERDRLIPQPVSPRHGR